MERREGERKGGREFVTGITSGPRGEAHARAKRARKEIRTDTHSRGSKTGAETATSAKTDPRTCRTIDSAVVGRPPNRRFRIVGKFQALDSLIFSSTLFFILLSLLVKIMNNFRGEKGCCSTCWLRSIDVSSLFFFFYFLMIIKFGI